MPKVKMSLSAKERKSGMDLRNFTVVPIIGAANRRRMGGAAMLVPKPPEELPTLNRHDYQLCYDALGVRASDMLPAAQKKSDRLRAKLLKLGARDR